MGELIGSQFFYFYFFYTFAQQLGSSAFQYFCPSLARLSQAYHDPMLKLSIMTEQELNQIFGTLDSLIPLHEGRVLVPDESWLVVF